MAAGRASLVFFALACLVFENVHAQTVYRVCASPGKVATECQALERGASKVTCVKATDSVDCLLKMEQDQADFVLLTAEETILAATAQPERYNVLASVRHEDRRYQNFAFQSVAVVRAEHTGGLSGLAKGGLCHPGYGKGKEQLWSDRVLKYFEKKTAMASRKCVSGSKSSAEDDANDLNNFFSAACRPGPWLLNPAEDKKLKLKFPALCSLCTADGTPDCDGYRYFEPRAVPGVALNSHLSAMECLSSGKGSVAYVAYNHVVDYFKSKSSEMSKFALLCENGTSVPLTGADQAPTSPPCAWVKQPWAALVARKSISVDLQADLKKWMPQGRADNQGSWVDSLDSIIFRDRSDVMEYLPNLLTPAEYIVQGRPLPSSEVNPCHKSLRWCTVSALEQSKCAWVRGAALTVGLLPEITCVQASSHIDCLAQVRDKRADFVGIDTNLGYLARKHYEQTAVMYSETTRTLTSKVLAVIKNNNDSSITRFENIRNKNACFPEYGGIAWAAFVRAARERKVIDANVCDYASEVGQFFSAACAPGARDPAHFPSKSVDPERLCSGCRGFSPRGASGANEAGVTVPKEQECPADFSNTFYGTTGALRCLSQPDSNVAFLEGQYLKEKAQHLQLKQEDFRVLCRNGSLAVNSGFDVDENCALSNTIDSELVARRDYEDKLSLQLLIQELDTWFGYNSGTVALINLQIFSPFNNTKDLLFKDSTIGVATNTSDNEFVKNYIELNEHTDKCSGAAAVGALLPAVLAMLAAKYWLL